VHAPDRAQLGAWIDGWLAIECLLTDAIRFIDMSLGEMASRKEKRPEGSAEVAIRRGKIKDRAL